MRDDLAPRLVPPVGRVVDGDGREESVDCADERHQTGGGDDDRPMAYEHVPTHLEEPERCGRNRHPRGNRADDGPQPRCRKKVFDRVIERASDDHSEERRRKAQRARADGPDRRGCRRPDHDRAGLQGLPRHGKALGRVSASDPGQRQDLPEKDQRRRAAHEAGDERVRDEACRVAGAECAEHDLQHAGHDDRRAGDRDNRLRATRRRGSQRRVGGEHRNEARKDQRRSRAGPAPRMRGAAEQAGGKMTPDGGREPCVHADVEIGRAKRRKGEDTEGERRAEIGRCAREGAGKAVTQIQRRGRFRTGNRCRGNDDRRRTLGSGRSDRTHQLNCAILVSTGAIMLATIGAGGTRQNLRGVGRRDEYAPLATVSALPAIL